MKDIKGVNKKYHLQGARRKPDTIKIEEKFIKQIEEQIRLEFQLIPMK